MTGKYSKSLGVACGLAVAIVWGSWSVVTRYALITDLSPYDLTFLRFGVSAILLWPVLLGCGPALAATRPVHLLVMALGAGVPFMLLASIGTTYAPASHLATLMIGAMPVFVFLLSAMLLKQRFRKVQIAGLAAVVVGVCLIGGAALFTNRSAGEWRGDLLFLLCGLLFAAYSVAQRASGLSAWQATAFVNVISALVFAPIYFAFLHPRVLEIGMRDLAMHGFIQGIWVAILGLVFYAEAGRRLGTANAAIFGALSPVATVALAAYWLGEMPGPAILGGVAMVALGVTCVVAPGRALVSSDQG